MTLSMEAIGIRQIIYWIFFYNPISKIKIQELSTPVCSHCAKAKEILEKEIKPNFPDVAIEYIDMLSEEG